MKNLKLITDSSEITTQEYDVIYYNETSKEVSAKDGEKKPTFISARGRSLTENGVIFLEYSPIGSALSTLPGTGNTNYASVYGENLNLCDESKFQFNLDDWEIITHTQEEIMVKFNPSTVIGSTAELYYDGTLLFSF